MGEQVARYALRLTVPWSQAIRIGAENGQEGIEEYTQARIINIAL